MVRAAFYDEKGLKKGAWSKEEDDKLREYILRYGHWNWRELPKFAGLSRCGKSCRLRWMNYLRPDLKHGNFTKEEDDLIFQLYQQLGTKWSAIASKMPGRTDNEIKNYWHAHLKKRLGWTLKNESRSSSSSPLPSSSSSHRQHSDSTTYQTHGQTYEMEADCTMMTMISPPILESSPFSPETTSSASPPVAGSWDDDHEYNKDSGLFGRCGTVQNERGVDSYNNYHNCYDSSSNNGGGGGDFWSEPFVVDDSTIYDGGEIMSYNSDQQYNFPLLDDDVESLMYRVMQELPDATTSSCLL